MSGGRIRNRSAITCRTRSGLSCSMRLKGGFGTHTYVTRWNCSDRNGISCSAKESRTTTTVSPSRKTVVVVRDSFAEQLIPFLSEQFQRVTYVWVPNPPFSLIEQESPDLVLQVMAERFLIRPPLMPDWELRESTGTPSSTRDRDN